MRVMDVGLSRFGRRSLLVRTQLDPTRGRASHRHPHVEVDLVLTGSATYRLPGGDAVFGPGDLLWLPPDVPHRLIHESVPLIMMVGFLERQACPWLSVPMSCRLDDREVVDVCRRFREPDGPHAVLVRILKHRGSPVSRARPRHPALERALGLAHADPARADLRSLSSRSGCSADHLAHLWRRDQGQTLTSSCIRLRLLSAIAAWTPGRSLRTLAAEAGFTTYRRFHRAFIRFAGRSPRSWVGGS